MKAIRGGVQVRGRRGGGEEQGDGVRVGVKVVGDGGGGEGREEVVPPRFFLAGTGRVRENLVVHGIMRWGPRRNNDTNNRLIFLHTRSK